MKSDKQTKFLFERMQVTCPLFYLIILLCVGLSGCGILIPNITSDKVDMVDLNDNDFVKVIIDDTNVKNNETGGQFIENIQELFLKKFKHTSIDSSYQKNADDCLYIKPESVFEAFHDNTKSKIKSKILVIYGQQSEEMTFEGSGEYGGSALETLLVTVPLGVATMGLSFKAQLALYNKIAQSNANKAVSSKVFNGIVVNPLFNRFNDSVKMAQSLPSDLSLNAKFSDTSGLFPNNIMDAAEEGEMVVTITNKGKGAGYGVVLEIADETSKIGFDKSITIGDIAPGETKELRFPIKADLDLADGKAAFVFSLQEKRGYDAKKLVLNVPTAKLEKPNLVIVSTEINDGDTGLAKGNGNGIPESGETIELTAFIKNDGVGKSLGVNLVGSGLPAGVEWVRENTLVGTIQPGETIKAKLAFTIPRNFEGKDLSANLKIADVRGVSDAMKAVSYAYAKQSPNLQYAYKVYSKGSPVTTVTNGGEYELELTLNNRGQLAARDVSIGLSASGPSLSRARIEAGEIKDGAELPGQRVSFSLPRTFSATEMLLNITITQTDFGTANSAITIPVAVKSPRLQFITTLRSKSGGNNLEQGEQAILEMAVTNEGNLPAEGVKVSIVSRDENLKIISQKDYQIGKIPAQSRSEMVKFQLSSLRRIRTGDALLDIHIGQDEFAPVNAQYALNIRKEGVEVIDVAAEDMGRGTARAQAGQGPKINLKSAAGTETTEETYRLAFDVSDPRNIEKVAVTINGVALPLSLKDGLTTTLETAKQISRNIKLAEGENRIAITAYNADNQVSWKELTVRRLGEEDVDTPPVTGINNPNAVAIVIGVSKYENANVTPVDFARRDASKVRDYLIKTFGYKEEKIIDLYDNNVTASKIKTAVKKLKRQVKTDSDVFVYFSGHGLVDPVSKDPFFATYDLDPDNVQETAYGMKDLYRQLEGINARSVTVVIDACFSGASDSSSGQVAYLIKEASAIFLEVTNPALKIKNGVVFTSSSGKQVSNWYTEKQHGLFTYFFLQGLRGKADMENKGVVTARDMERYLQAKVPDQALRLRNRQQTPEVMGRKDTVLVKYR